MEERTRRGLRAPKNKDVPKIKLLVGIVGVEDASKIATACNDVTATLSYAFEAFGTARTAVLDFLGLGETEKRMVIALLPDVKEAEILENIQRETELYLVGKGICFTLPLTGVSSIVANGLVKGIPTAQTGKEKKMKKTEEKKREYDLIVAAMENGYAEEAMDAAREAGAAGGTIVHALTLDNRKAEQLIGVTLQKETEILMILTKSEGKLAIMRALQEAAGLKTDAGGVLFSLPVDNLIGISR